MAGPAGSRRLSLKPAFRPRGITERQACTSLRHLAPFELGVVIWTSALTFLAMVVATFWTAPTALMFGALAAAFSAFAFLVAGGSMFSFLSAWARFPVDLTVVILAFVLSFAPWTDNHGVRVLEREETAMPPDERPSLDVALENWRKALGEPQETPTFVIVATAGGGLRARPGRGRARRDRGQSYADSTSTCSRSAASRAAVSVRPCSIRLLELEDAKVLGTAGCDDETRQSILPSGALHSRAGLSRARRSGLLYPDLLQRFIPLPRPFPRLPDRAMSTEQGWEQGWRREDVVGLETSRPGVAHSSGFGMAAEPKQSCWRPALLLNGTHVETGKRIITSNLKIETNLYRRRRHLRSDRR